MASPRDYNDGGGTLKQRVDVEAILARVTPFQPIWFGGLAPSAVQSFDVQAQSLNTPILIACLTA